MSQAPPDEDFPPEMVHVLRTVQQLHMELSKMADQKASILLAATFIVFTIAIGQASGPDTPLPLLILGVSAFFSAGFAVLAVLPSTRYRTGGKPNMLFFGAFASLGEEEYVERLIAQIRRKEEAFRAMARDVYQNGVVLERRKYRLLGYAYRIFLAGLAASSIAFAVEYFG